MDANIELTDFSHVLTIPTRWSDLDMLGHVNNTRFFTFDEDARLSYFEPLMRMDWQVHVYGSTDAELSAWCTAQKLPLHVFTWRDQHQAAGLARDALYLLRPDTYVALADPRCTIETLRRYLADQQIRLQ